MRTGDAENKIDRPLVLVGIMGAGKTHIGKMLAGELGLEFKDSDALIEEKAGCTITEIFQRDGEEKFREVEANTIRDLLNEGPQIISTGGGAPANPKTLRAIKEKAIGIWVQADIRDILSRTSGNTSRPLLNVENPEEVLINLLNKRKEFYEQMPIHTENKDGNMTQVLKEILTGIDKVLKRG